MRDEVNLGHLNVSYISIALDIALSSYDVLEQKLTPCLFNRWQRKSKVSCNSDTVNKPELFA